MNPFLMSPVRLDGGEVYYLHNSTASRSCAFSIGDRKSIRLCAPRHLGVYRACAQLYAEHGEPLLVLEGAWISHVNGRDEYEFRLPKSLAVGLYFFDIELSTSSGMLYAHKVGDTISLSYNKSDSHLQISISDFKYEEPKQAYGGVIYHIFVDRFAKSNVKKRLSAAPTSPLTGRTVSRNTPNIRVPPSKTTPFGAVICGELLISSRI